LAVTQIHSIETTLVKALDYIMNPEKTDEKLLISGYQCEPEFARLAFELTKKEAGKTGGRLAYHMIQSFKPGEVSYEMAHEIGRKFADEILKGQYELIVSTHIDRGHVHNHILFNSVSFDTHKKFNAPADIFHRIQRESDKLCQEYGLSVIDEKSGEKGRSYKEYSEEKKGTSWKSKLREAIDKNVQKAQSWEEFIALMEADRYEVKRGKHIGFKAEEQGRFIRSKTLGVSYEEEAIKQRIIEKIKMVGGGAVTVPETKKAVKKQDSKAQSSIKLLIDIENSVKAKRSAGYSHWATIQNITMIAKTTNYITEHGLSEYSVLAAKHSDIKGRRDTSLAKIKEVESRITQIKKQIEIIEDYRKFKPVVDKLDSVVFKDKYRREHDTAFILFNAAKQNMKAYFGKEKLPKIKNLRAELNELYPEKNKLYSTYYTAKNELKEIDVIKKNVEQILGRTPERDTPHRQRQRNREIGEPE
jgi:hypothetical protein